MGAADRVSDVRRYSPTIGGRSVLSADYCCSQSVSRIRSERSMRPSSDYVWHVGISFHICLVMTFWNPM